MSQRIDLGLTPHTECRAIVIVPACNEEETLGATLDTLRRQVTLDGMPMAFEKYEVHILLNNCTDASETIATEYCAMHPLFRVALHTCTLIGEEAHVGTARSMLMDFACSRLEMLGNREMTVILSTDADTLVAPDWVAQNLAEIESGADAVGGLICIASASLADLDAGARRAYQRDLIYQTLVAQFESKLDPDPADPFPRHLHHFGASLACTPFIYRKSGGMPPVRPLEDVAFVDAMRRVGAKVRHSCNVKIFTSARLDGRAEIGLSGQLRIWSEDEARAVPQIVDTAEWLQHRFLTMANLRGFFLADNENYLDRFPMIWHERMLQLKQTTGSIATFLNALDSETLIDILYQNLEGKPARRGEIASVIESLKEKMSPSPIAP